MKITSLTTTQSEGTCGCGSNTPPTDCCSRVRVYPNFVAGERRAGSASFYGDVYNPATAKQIGEVPFASSEEVNEAVAVAHEAAPSWGGASLADRTQVMFSARNVLREHVDELAALITTENGKTHADAIGEVKRGLEAIEFSCGMPSHVSGNYSRSVSDGVDVYSVREPLGVVACITPFNFPVMVPLWMLANALSCGNAVVHKPSEKAPSASLRLAELLTEAGLPPGVLNVVNGDSVTVDRILTHPDIDGVSFIGSTPVARHVYEQGTQSGKRVQALGGAKNHMVVMPDADIGQAADAAVAAGFGAAGERCMAVSVVVAVGDAGDAVVPALSDRMAGLRVGAGMEDGVDYGPLVTGAHRDRVAAYLDAGAHEGAKVVVDGRDHPVCERSGFFLGPSLLDQVTSKMSVYRDEIFGPVLSVVRVPNYEAALSLVNSSEFGNGAAIFTRDGGTARHFETACNIGMIGVNVPIPVPVGWYSFGGWKSSMFGDSHMYGPDGLRFFTRQKVVTSRW